MNKTFLVVDDSLVSRMMIKSIIEDIIPSCNIIEAANGKDALELVKTNENIDIALIDYNMPGMTGLELIAELANMITIPKRALLTANIQDDVRNRAEQAGVTFINKPINVDIIGPFISQ